MNLVKSFAWCRIKEHSGPVSYPPEIQAERDKLAHDIEFSKGERNKMGVREIEARRHLIAALAMLAYQVEAAHFNVANRMWDDATLDSIWAEMKEKEEALINIKQDIRLAELEIADAERTYNNPEAWTPEMAPRRVR